MLFPLRAEGVASPAPGAERGPSGGNFQSLKTYLRDQEQEHLNRALKECGGDKEQAALMLGISLATLYRKLSEEEKEA